MEVTWAKQTKVTTEIAFIAAATSGTASAPIEGASRRAGVRAKAASSTNHELQAHSGLKRGARGM
jgi:hypothetical protein